MTPMAAATGSTILISLRAPTCAKLVDVVIAHARRCGADFGLFTPAGDHRRLRRISPAPSLGGNRRRSPALDDA